MAIIILFAFLVQASGILILFNTSCNLLLITTIFASLKCIPYSAGFFGFFCGILLDLLGIRRFGINALSFSIIAILVSIFSKRIYHRVYIIFFLVFLSTIFSGIISLFLLFLFEGFLLNFFHLLKEGLYNSLLASLIFIFIRKRL
ncbi:MAG: rod shape-determining protein MreD [bacterium]